MIQSSTCSLQACSPQDLLCHQATLSCPYLCQLRPTGRSSQVLYNASYCAYLYLGAVYVHKLSFMLSLLQTLLAEQIYLVMEHTIVIMPSQFIGCNCDLVNTADQKAETTPIKVAIPTEVNRKAFPDSPGGLISPGDNSTVYEPDRQATFSGCLKTNHIVRRPLRPQRHFKGCCSPIC